MAPIVAPLVVLLLASPAVGLLQARQSDQPVDMKPLISDTEGMTTAGKVEAVLKGLTSSASAFRPANAIFSDAHFLVETDRIAQQILDGTKTFMVQISADADRVQAGTLSYQEFFRIQLKLLENVESNLGLLVDANGAALPELVASEKAAYTEEGRKALLPMFHYYVTPFEKLQNAKDEDLCTELFTFLSDATGLDNPTRYRKASSQIKESRALMPKLMKAISSPSTYPDALAAIQKVDDAWTSVYNSFDFMLLQMLTKVAKTAETNLKCPWHVWCVSDACGISPNTEHGGGH